LELLESLPACEKVFAKYFGRQEVADAFDHAVGGLAGDIGARQTFAEAAPAITAGDLDNYGVALFAAMPRMAKGVVERK
jgi:hypothetical protein